MLFKLTLARMHSGVDIDWIGGLPAAVKIEEDAHQWLAVIGKVYDEASPTELLERLGAGEFPEGRFVVVQFDKLRGRIHVWVDKYRLLGAFFIHQAGKIVISNNPWACRPEFDDDLIDPRGVSDLLILGYVQPPLTLYTHVRMLSGFDACDWQNSALKTRDWREFWPTPQEDVETGALFQSFREATNQLVRAWQPGTFRLSGGVDTRLVAAVLDEDLRREMRLEVVCAPYLSASEDRDVRGAVEVAAALRQTISVLHMPPETSAFFAGLEGAALAGLYGGEFLGGVMFREDIVDVVTGDLSEVPAHIGVDADAADETLRRYRSGRGRLGERRFLTSVFLGAFRSEIYRSVRYSWSMPSSLGQLALSPFAESRFLDGLLIVPTERLVDYAIYNEIVRDSLSPELRSIPFSSPILNFTDQLPRFESGVDPKFRPAISESSEDVWQPKFVGILHRLGLSESEYPKHARRLRNLHNAFMDL